MINITYPDGVVKSFDREVTGFDIANNISKGLAKKALVIEVNKQLQDLLKPIVCDAEIKIITVKDVAGLEVIRHSCAHLLAQAVKCLYPDAQVTIGPIIEDGFYYDFYYPAGFSVDDLPIIEAKMAELVAANLSIEYKVVSKQDAVDYFLSIGESYKAEIVQDLADDEVIKIYQQGDFWDLCRGPHVPSTGFIKAFKLTGVAGAYWRGDSNNVMLQRIYGTAWADKKQLQEYLHLKEEAKKRDHRLLAKKMDLFHVQPESPGMIFWHPNGWGVYQLLKDYVRSKYIEYGYQEISTPQLVDSSLWQKSGHLEKFSDDMFSVQTDSKIYALKPMNCPCHVQVFNHNLRSYKDLPFRLAEMGSCHRNEPSGTLHGLMRVRNFIQDDGHIFCTEDQVKAEVLAFIEQVSAVYADFGFNGFKVKFSTRPQQRVGSDDVWDHAELVLKDVLVESKLDWELCPGEGAFYGPKLEFVLQDCLKRSWQCGTVQLDFSMPSRLSASYIGSEGVKKTPVMIHRAMLGSLERFLGILLENSAGCLPFWLAFVQIVVINVAEDSEGYVLDVVSRLQKDGFRVVSDIRNEKIGFKIREHSIKRVPFIAICGNEEKQNNTVALRNQLGDNLGVLHYDAMLSVLKEQIGFGKV